MSIAYDVTTYKVIARISGTALDAMLTDALLYAKALYELAEHRTLDTATFTEKINGTGSSQITVSNPPITSITSIKVYRTPGDTPTAEDSTSYTYEASTGIIAYQPSYTGRFALDSYYDVIGPNYGQYPNFPVGFQNIEVVYVGGYTANTYGNAIIFILFKLVDLVRFTIGQDPTLQAEGLGSYNYQRMQGTLGASDAFQRAAADIMRPIRTGVLL